MSNPANVHSLEAIEAVRRALVLFADQVSDALTELDAEMRRVLDWLEHDRPRHWRGQVRRAMDEVHDAQQALHRCLMFPVANERPSCYEERAALRKAQAHQAYCEDKFERVRHWHRAVQHELFEYQGRISQLVQLVEVDVPYAIGILDKIMRRIEEYQAVRSPDPHTAYASIAQDLWPDEQPSTPPAGEAASAAVDEINTITAETVEKEN